MLRRWGWAMVLLADNYIYIYVKEGSTKKKKKKERKGSDGVIYQQLAKLKRYGALQG